MSKSKIAMASLVERNTKGLDEKTVARDILNCFIAECKEEHVSGCDKLSIKPIDATDDGGID